MRIEASDVARITSGTLVGVNQSAYGISFDTRSIAAGDAFVAVTGERDGHDFLPDAKRAGAAFAIVQRGRSFVGLTCIEVDDPVEAIGVLARDCRRRMSATVGPRVVGITGSAGKTSTKDMVDAVLSSTFESTHVSPVSLNNDIGVPVTIINAPEECDALVLEMGMRGFGEIARLCAIAEPTIAVVTNVGDAHGERVGGADGIARAKAELVSALEGNGIAILNGDDERVRAMATVAPGEVLLFGESETCDVRWAMMSTDDQGRCEVSISHDGQSASVVLPVPGRHMASNASAAVAVGVSCGVPLSVAVAALAGAEIAAGRMRWKETRSGVRILDDSYNANMASTIAALRTVASVPARCRVAVLGEMAETTDFRVSHDTVAALAHELGVDLLPLETDAYGLTGMSVDDIVDKITQMRADVVVVKGSRVSRTERVVAALTK